MTAEEKHRIRESFAVLRDQAGPVAMLFYGKLISLDPTAKRLFHNDLALQGKKLMDTLNAVVESLDEFHVMQPRLADLGRRHAEYGVRPEQYDTLEKALLWTLAQALGADFDPPTREAWQAAIRAINSAMKKA